MQIKVLMRTADLMHAYEDARAPFSPPMLPPFMLAAPAP